MKKLKYRHFMFIKEEIQKFKNENIFENRFMHIPELNGGANISIEGNKAKIKGNMF